MNLMRVAKNNLLSQIKDYYLCIMTIAFSTAIIFISINNSPLTSSNIDFIKSAEVQQTAQMGNGFGIAGLLTIFVAFAMSCYAAYYLATTKVKELGIMGISGASILQTATYAGIQNVIIEVIGSAIGIVLGVICSPILNLIMSNIFDMNNAIWNISLENIGLTLLIIIIQIVFSILVATGFSYRNSISDLLDYDRKNFIDDIRLVKFPTIVYWITYLISLVILYFIGSEEESTLTDIIALIACINVSAIIKQWIPQFMDKQRKRGAFYVKEKMIWAGNAVKLITRTGILLIIMMIGIVISQLPLLKANEISNSELFSYYFKAVSFLLLLSFTLLFKIVTEINERRKEYKQINILGYSRKQIKNTIKCEVVVYFLIFTIASMLPLCIIGISKVVQTSLSLMYVLKVLSPPFLLILGLGFITYSLYKKAVFKALEEC